MNFMVQRDAGTGKVHPLRTNAGGREFIYICDVSNVGRAAQPISDLSAQIHNNS